MSKFALVSMLGVQVMARVDPALLKPPDMACGFWPVGAECDEQQTFHSEQGHNFCNKNQSNCEKNGPGDCKGKWCKCGEVCQKAWVESIRNAQPVIPPTAPTPPPMIPPTPVIPPTPPPMIPPTPVIPPTAPTPPPTPAGPAGGHYETHWTRERHWVPDAPSPSPSTPAVAPGHWENHYDQNGQMGPHYVYDPMPTPSPTQQVPQTAPTPCPKPQWKLYNLNTPDGPEQKEVYVEYDCDTQTPGPVYDDGSKAEKEQWEKAHPNPNGQGRPTFGPQIEADVTLADSAVNSQGQKGASQLLELIAICGAVLGVFGLVKKSRQQTEPLLNNEVA